MKASSRRKTIFESMWLPLRPVEGSEAHSNISSGSSRGPVQQRRRKRNCLGHSTRVTIVNTRNNILSAVELSNHFYS